MSWGRLDDKMHRNPKVLSMSDGAFRLWALSISYALDTPDPNGFLTRQEAVAFARSMGKGTRTIAELVAVNGWEEVADGWLIHDFPEFLQHGSRDRVRRYRERIRNADVTLQAPLPKRDGNVTSRVRGPEPVPVPVKLSKKEQHRSEDPRVLAVVEIWQDRVGGLVGLADLRRAAQRWVRLTPETATQEARRVLGDYQERGERVRSMAVLVPALEEADHNTPTVRTNGRGSAERIDSVLDRITGRTT